MAKSDRAHEGDERELQNEIARMMREIFKMLNQYATDIPTLPVNPVSFPTHPVPGGMRNRSLGTPRRKNELPSI